jgi:hypothetical protein
MSVKIRISARSSASVFDSASERFVIAVRRTTYQNTASRSSGSFKTCTGIRNVQRNGKMAKENLIDVVSPEIPSDEKILKEGTMRTIRLHKKVMTKFSYKYALTEKGIWTRSGKVFLVKPVTQFMPYEKFESYERTVHDKAECFIFRPKEGIPASAVYFDDPEGVAEALGPYLRTEEK